MHAILVNGKSLRKTRLFASTRCRLPQNQVLVAKADAHDAAVSQYRYLVPMLMGMVWQTGAAADAALHGFSLF